eukprot:tig00000851_g4888.t1
MEENIAFIFSGSATSVTLGDSTLLTSLELATERGRPTPRDPESSASSSSPPEEEPVASTSGPALSITPSWEKGYQLERVSGDVLWAARALAEAGLDVTFESSSIRIAVPDGMSASEVEQYISMSDLLWAVETLHSGESNPWERGGSRGKPLSDVGKPKPQEKPPRVWRPKYSADDDDSDDNGSGVDWLRSVELPTGFEVCAGLDEAWAAASADLLDVLAAFDEEQPADLA